MLLEELAKDLVEVTSSLVGGRTINIMNTDGVIIASSEHERVGSFHKGARDAVRTGKVVNIHKEQLEHYPGAKEGCNMPLRVNGSIIGVVGIYGNPEDIQDVAHLLEVYATKYYQLEAMLHPRLSESVMRSQLLASLLSPPNAAMSAAHSLMETLNIRLQFPVYTWVISCPEGLSLPERSEKLLARLETAGFLRRQYDVWGVVDERMILIASHLDDRSLEKLHGLQELGYRISMGLPGENLWDIRQSYHQALVLDQFSEEPVNDIRQMETRCRYLLSRTAMDEEFFLEAQCRKLAAAVGGEECRILLESVAAYYDCGKSVSAAAQKLFIHKNTLQYRVRRVLEALDITGFPTFRQEYLIRLMIEHFHRKSRP